MSEPNSLALRLYTPSSSCIHDITSIAVNNYALPRCVNISEEDLNHHSSLYIGGVNLFLLSSSSNLQTTNFVGGIRNVAVGGEFLDLSCPAAGVNTITGGYQYTPIQSEVPTVAMPRSRIVTFFLSFFCRSCAFAWLCRDELQLQPQCSVCGLCRGILLPVLGRVLITDMQDNREQPGN